MNFIKQRKRNILIIFLVTLLLFLNGCVKDTNNNEENTMEDFKWWQKSVVYEIYVRSFKDSNGDGIGDLNGITSKLDYLKDLGVGAIWLTPCYVSPQADNGYDVADYYNIAPEYGTMEDMDNLIAEASKRDIKIVMDLVFNHTSIENEWFKTSRTSKDNDKSDWYIWEDPINGGPPTNWRSIFGGSAWEFDETRGQYYLHTFLKEQPDLNWENPEVRKALIDVAKYWADKGADGFRLDAITYIKKPQLSSKEADASDGMIGIHGVSANTEGILDFLQEFKFEVKKGRDIFIVGEANGVSPNDLEKWVGENGVLDMIFEFDHELIDLPDENKWYETRDWNLVELKDIFTESQNMIEQTNGWYPMYLENHDQPRSISHFLTDETDRDLKGKALATLMLTMRGTPFIMEGQELGLINVKWPSIDYYKDVSTINHYNFAIDMGCSTEEAMQGVHRFSRDNARTPMPWDTSKNAGFTSGTPWILVNEDYEIYNATSEAQDSNSVLNWYKTLIKLREEHNELIVGNYKEFLHEDSQIFAYTRKANNKEAIVLINLSNQEAKYDETYIKNSKLLISTNSENKEGILAPYEAVIYERESD